MYSGFGIHSPFPNLIPQWRRTCCNVATTMGASLPPKEANLFNLIVICWKATLPHVLLFCTWVYVLKLCFSWSLTNHLVALHFSMVKLLNLFFCLSQYMEAMHDMVQCLEMVCTTIEEGLHAPCTIPNFLHIDCKEIAGVVCDASCATILLKRIVYRIFLWRSFCHLENLAYL
jgi:hypothetical protein